MNDHLKLERALKNNLQNLYTLIIALCDAEVKNQVKGLPYYKEWDKKLDSMSVLKEIKKIVYTGGRNNQHIKYNKARTLMNLMDILQDKHQDIQDFRDQYLAIYKVCKEVGLRIRGCNDNAKAILKQEGVEDPTKERIKGALDRPRKNYMPSYSYTKLTDKNIENILKTYKTMSYTKRPHSEDHR